LSFVRLCRVEPRINLQLTSKVLLKLDANSSLLFEYGYYLQLPQLYLFFYKNNFIRTRGSFLLKI